MPKKLAAIFTIGGSGLFVLCLFIVLIGVVLIGDSPRPPDPLDLSGFTVGPPVNPTPGSRTPAPRSADDMVLDWHKRDRQMYDLIVGVTAWSGVLAFMGFGFAVGGGLFWVVAAREIPLRFRRGDYLGLKHWAPLLIVLIVLPLGFPFGCPVSPLLWWIPWAVTSLRTRHESLDGTTSPTPEVSA